MIRLGRISYVNMAPVFYRLDHEVEEVTGVPTELNERLLAGEIDLAPIWLRTKANSIEGGTSEVQLNIIAKNVLRLPGA